TWSVEGADTGQPKLVSKKQRQGNPEQDVPLRSYKELVDASGRRLILFVSDCRSQLWRQGQIHDWLAFWSQNQPTAIVQLLPECLWNQSELDVGFAVQVSSLIPGAPNPKLQIRELFSQPNIAPTDALTLPIVTLTVGALKQWALVVAAAGRQRAPARLFDLSWVKDPERDRSLAVIRPKSAKERVELFAATASPIAQQLASMMAAVPVELPVVHLIQEELLPSVQPVHIAEVYSSGLLEEIRSEKLPLDASARYDFVEGVRELLNKITPLDETLGVLEALSQRIARTLGFEIKSFTALLSPGSDWSQEEKDAILPFAQIATEVLYRLGGDYAELAQLVEQDAKVYPDWIQPIKTEQTFPDLEVLEFTTAQLVDPLNESSPENQLPPVQTQEVEVVTIIVESEPEGLERFEFEVATIERRTDAQQPGLLQGLRNFFSGSERQSNWVIRKQRQQAYQWIEPLGDLIQQRIQATSKSVERSDPRLEIVSPLEMVSIPAGTFMMGSPKDEVDRPPSESPQHEVSVPTFFMSKYPITQSQWRFVSGLPQVNRNLAPNPSNFKGGNRPVEQVSWYEAVEFCDRLSAYTGREYRLPTEVEWEYACRAGTTTPFHFGETIAPELANYDSSRTYNDGPQGKRRGETTPVDHFGIANAFGLSDMHGNVWEWCLDHWHDSYEGAPTDGSAWISEDENASRVLRGGSWDGTPWSCRSACRTDLSPDTRYSPFGFRVVCVAPRTL
ncbi:formylglycine-generating enzyme family protein, partial [Leptolyngbya sp. FACHB-711]|uniref:formylglycine-generating enzyme family protein n=1 Tax=Leptolyngbya sp. FACHB-711 TaxID=2692813 RepID=UPI001F5541AA